VIEHAHIIEYYAPAAGVYHGIQSEH
jgi:hypothetical protein